MSVLVSPSGWSWLVSGRRLLVWRHRLVPGARALSSCRELTLPPSDLAHSAKLVNVFSAAHSATTSRSVAADTLTPSCIAVSPEGQQEDSLREAIEYHLQLPTTVCASSLGVIRYWPSIAHESSWVELSADLQGQECCSLTDAHPVGSVLATTTSTVGLVRSPLVSWSFLVLITKN